MNKAKRPIDLIVTASFAVLGAVVSLIGIHIPVLRAILGVSLILILPGFALWSALFPKRSPGAVEQILIIGGLSIFLAGLGGILLDRTHLGLHTSSWAITLCVITLIACLVAWMRRRSLDVESPLLPRLNLTWSQGAILCLAGVLTIAAVRLAQMPTSQLSEFQGYTVLWMVPAGDDAPNTVRVGLIGNEFETTKYNVRLTVDNKTIHAWEDIQLAPGEKWDATYKLPGKFPDSTRVEALLYKVDSPYSVYRRVWLSLKP
jgi:uncharacterized membrane protein